MHKLSLCHIYELLDREKFETMFREGYFWLVHCTVVSTCDVFCNTQHEAEEMINHFVHIFDGLYPVITVAYREEDLSEAYDFEDLFRIW